MSQQKNALAIQGKNEIENGSDNKEKISIKQEKVKPPPEKKPRIN